ncbi:MAG: heavy metal translocating P-type ATPase, partial [Christensenellaceae bacterium]
GCGQEHEQIHGEACGCGHEHEQIHGEACGCGHEHTHENSKTYLLRIIIGSIIFGMGILLQNTLELHIWVRFGIFLAAYLILGYNVLLSAGKNILHGKIFDENFLMTIATVGAFVLGDFAEGTAVMLFYLVGETLSDMAVQKSKKSITKLMDIRPDYANLKVGDTTQKVRPQEVKIGNIIVIKPYEKVAMDGKVMQGESDLDTAALTGESMPRSVAAGDKVLAGCVNGGGILEVQVEKEYGQSTVAKILDLVQNASEKKAKTEKFITKFARYYTPIVCAGALIIALIPSLITGEWSVWVYRALLFLVISCPCALVVCVPLTYFGGIGGASKKGILIKGANYLEALANVNEVVFDKTGTLTKGTFCVSTVNAVDGFSKQEVLKLAANAEINSAHPIAKSVVQENTQPLELLADSKELAGYGVSVKLVNGDEILAGNAKLMKKADIAYEQTKQGATVLYVAKNRQYIGNIVIEDTIKEDALQAVQGLKIKNIGTTMLTGDNQKTAEKVAQELGIDNAYWELLPQDKVRVLEDLKDQNKTVAFVGDGINDAPVLARADVGIAMGGMGSDAAIEAADVVIMNDEPSKVVQAINLSKKTRHIIWQNIVFALAVKAAVMVLGICGLAGLWAAVFADVGVTLIAVLNSLRALHIR